MDIKLSGKGDEVFQPLPAGWTGFLYSTSTLLVVETQVNRLIASQ
jgi:hypothetical protein